MGQHKQFKCPQCKDFVYPKKMGQKIVGDTITTTYACKGKGCKQTFIDQQPYVAPRNK